MREIVARDCDSRASFVTNAQGTPVAPRLEPETWGYESACSCAEGAYRWTRSPKLICDAVR